MGITNTIATFPGFIGPAVVGAITYRNVSAARCDELLVDYLASAGQLITFDGAELDANACVTAYKTRVLYTHVYASKIT